MLLPSLLVPMNFFDTRNFLEGWKLPLRKLLVPWDKNWSTKSCYAKPLPPCPKKLRFQKFFQIWKGSPTKSFAAVRQQTLDVKPWYFLPSPLVLENLLDTRSVLENERLLYENFLQWDKNETSKSCYLPSFPKVFQNWKKKFGTQKCAPTEKISLL